MTSPEKDEREMLAQLREQLRRSRSALPMRLPSLEREPLYCGHKGDRVELECFLWDVVESMSRSSDEQLPEHVRDCPYCLMRLREISRALKTAAKTQPLEMFIPAPEPAFLRIVLEKTQKVVERTDEAVKQAVLAEVLVAVDAVGKWISGQAKSWLFLAPAPAFRGRSALRGRPGTREIIPFRGPETAPPTLEAKSLGVRAETEGLAVSAVIVPVQGKIELHVGCVTAQTGERPSGQLEADCTTDQGESQSAQLDDKGLATFSLPDVFSKIRAGVYYQGRPVAVIDLNVTTVKTG